MKSRGRLPTCLLMSALCSSCISFKAPSPPASPSPAWLQALHLISDSSKVTVFFTPADAVRARQIRFLRAASPCAETAALDDEEIIRRLEAISPGWREWITTFGARRR